MSIPIWAYCPASAEQALSRSASAPSARASSPSAAALDASAVDELTSSNSYCKRAISSSFPLMASTMFYRALL